MLTAPRFILKEFYTMRQAIELGSMIEKIKGRDLYNLFTFGLNIYFKPGERALEFLGPSSMKTNTQVFGRTSCRVK